MLSLRVLALALSLALCLLTVRARAEPLTPLPYALPTEEVVPLYGLALPPRVALREQVLQQYFFRERDGAKYRPWLVAGVLTLSATAVGFGIAYRREVGAFLIPFGGVALVRGLLTLALLPDPRPDASHYLHMPLFNAEQVRARIAFGEHVLRARALASRRLRYIEGTLSATAAASYVPLAWFIAQRRDPNYRFREDSWGYALLAISVVNVAIALKDMFSPSASEQVLQSYRELVARQEREAPGELDKLSDALSLSLFGTREQVAFAAQLRF